MIKPGTSALALILGASLALAPSLARGAEICTVATRALAFGVVDNRGDATGAGEIAVTCDRALSFEVKLTSALEGGGRRMVGPSGARMRYETSSQPNFLIPWGDGASIGPSVSASSDGATTRRLTVHGRVPRQEGLRPGAYSDQIEVMLVF